MHAKLQLAQRVQRSENPEEGAMVAQPLRQPVSAEQSAVDVKGSFDALDGNVVYGWARAHAESEDPLAIEVWADGQVVASGLADLFRGDLLEAGVGSGKHGFRIPLPLALCDGEPHKITVSAGASGVLLDPGARVFQHSGTSVTGHLAGLDGAFVVGWVRNLTAPQEPLQVELQIDGESVAVGVAADHTSEGMRFALRIPPSSLDGCPHTVAVNVRQPFHLVGATALILPTVLTPSDALRRYSGIVPEATLIDGAPARYEALRRQVNFLSRPDCPLTTKERLGRLSQIAAAHEQVVHGFDPEERPRRSLVPLEFPHVAAPLVSIVIPVHNKVSVTYNCLASLLLAPNDANFEVILVDDGSTDATLGLPKLIKGVRFLRHEEAEGFVRSCNDGAKHARGQYILMLNNDTEVTPAWIDELLHVFNHYDGVGMAGAKLLYPDGKLQEAGGIVWNNGDPWNYGRAGNAAEPRFNYTRQVDYVSGACIMLPKTLWDDLGGFDERFAPAYFEDADLAFRVRERGLKTVFTPFSRVTHFEGISSGTNVTSGMKRFQEINRPKFKSRWSRAFKNNGNVGRDPDINKDRNVRFRVLMIDSTTPQPDRDAGSYAAVQEMRLLQSLGFKVTFVPDNLAYLGRPTDMLQRSGIECVYAPFTVSISELLEERGHEFDVIYVTRYSIAQRHMDAIRRHAPQGKVIFNNADLHFLRELRAAITASSQDDIDKALKTREDELALMRKVDLVLSYNDAEHAVIVSHNLNSTRIARCPWVVEVPESTPGFDQREGIAFLGNFSHAPNAEAMEYFIRDVMLLVQERLPNIKLRIYGSHIPSRVEKLASENVTIEGWVPDIAKVYSTCRVFVAPLRSGAGLKGKVIGALAHGAPCVLSPIAAEGTGVRNGHEALIADTPRQWGESISRLHDNRDLWVKLQDAGRRYAGSEYSFSKGQNLMQAALEAVDIYATPDDSALMHRNPA